MADRRILEVFAFFLLFLEFCMKFELVKKILKIEEELDVRFSENKLNSYNKKKVHKKQMAFHRCKKRNRWVFGGNRSGKTECGAVEVVWLACGIHPFKKNKKRDGWVVSLSRQVQRDVAQKKNSGIFTKIVH